MTTTSVQASDIISMLPEKLKIATESGDGFLFPSVIHEHQDIGLEFQLRLCTALQKKPVGRNAAGQLSISSDSSAINEKDPFAPPYSPQLYVGELSLQDGYESSDYVVLGSSVKSTIKEFQPQASPLMPHDLVQTYLLLLAARKAK
ncbi:hypothetical protein JVU11DRAFT_2667 [Chiua virens]|nr:hypothetical protein JVU11DRAFT_2667 [Chiua virens]